MARSQRVVDGNWSIRAPMQVGLAVAGGVSLTPTADAQAALIQAQVADVRWRDDGTTPANGVGMLMTAGDPPFFYTGDLGAIEFEEDAAASGATITVAYYGWVD